MLSCGLRGERSKDICSDPRKRSILAGPNFVFKSGGFPLRSYDGRKFVTAAQYKNRIYTIKYEMQ